jgi:SpoVK/Ycf46/Vps4 family AAA+-type ATPase
MKHIATKVDVKATRDQLILPQKQLQQLHKIGEEVMKRRRPSKLSKPRNPTFRKTGVITLFAGESGTGKTMAAEVLANELSLDLYSIDLSSLGSKYIGETEKNLKKVLDVVNEHGSILFFDEADALFGKRSEVKDSHDCYANTEIGYLLQRMEAFPGLVILATNKKSALDKTLISRFQFIVDFPFPDKVIRR